MSTVFAQVNPVSIVAMLNVKKRHLSGCLFFVFIVRCGATCFQTDAVFSRLAILIDSFCVIVVFPISSW